MPSKKENVSEIYEREKGNAREMSSKALNIRLVLNRNPIWGEGFKH